MFPLVSIVIPLYNSATYISDTLNCIKNQTWKNYEIIIVDDGSTDNSFQIAKSFENESIIVVQQPNKGASAARNHGISLAKGDYIQFLDADDLISPDKIEAQLNDLGQNPGKISACSTIFFFDGDDYLLNSPAGTELNYLYSTANSFEFLMNLYGANGQKAMVTVHSWLTPRTVLEEAGPWNENINVDDDGEYFCRVILASSGIVYTPNVYNYYRKFKKGANLSAKSDTKAIVSMVNAIDLKYGHIIKKCPEQIERINLTMAKHYLSAAASLYPKHKEIVDYCLQKAKKLGYTKIDYEGGKAGKLFSKFFGWKLTKDFSYISQLIKRNLKVR